MNYRGLYVMEAALIVKATKLLKKVNAELADGHRISLKLANRWVDAFKKRHRFRSYLSHGESGDADESTIR